jgi:hypothetical protein
MPIRSITLDGRTWRVFPSGHTTQYFGDEFALIFVTGEGDDREVRVSRYVPQGERGRDRSLAELSDERLVYLLAHSMASDAAPEVGYRKSPIQAAGGVPPRLAAGAPGGDAPRVPRTERALDPA